MSKIDEWISEEQGKHFCHCGCGGKIIIKPHHYKKGIPKYLPAHHTNFFYNQIISHEKKTKIQDWIKQEQGKHFCGCGCGQEIKITAPHYTKGIPKYIKWHHNKVLNMPDKTYIEEWVKKEQNKNRLCMCGCGSKIIVKPDHYIKGIPEYIHSHSHIGKKQSEKTKKKISESLRGKKHSDERIKVRMNSRRGYTHSDETKIKISVSRVGKYVGANSPNWMGGRSFEPYCPKFNNELKERIRNRDNRTCQKCGCEENGRKLSVHHIHYDKENCYPDLISLCIACHTSSNTNRNFWEEYYMDILETRGLLNWS